MALPKKKSRQIEVNGASYRWTVSSASTQAASAERGFALTLIVDNTGMVNARLYDRIEFPNLDSPYDHYFNHLNQDNSLVYPRHVATVIKTAVAAGWAPSHSETYKSKVLYGLILNDLPEEISRLVND